MTSKNKTTSIPDASLVIAPTTVKAYPTNCFPPLDFRFTVSKHSDQNPMIIIFSVPSNTPIPDATNTPVDPTEAFITIVCFLLHLSPMNQKLCSFSYKTSSRSSLILRLSTKQLCLIQKKNSY